MSLMIQETFIDRTRNAQFGESDWYEPFTDDIGKLFHSLQKEYGRCTGKVYVDQGGKTTQVGWVFQKVMVYEDSRPPLSGRDYYIREVWVSVADEVETIPRHHKVKYHNFRETG